MREMKDSGVEWIGDIPIEWSSNRIKFHFANKKIIVGALVNKYQRLALTMRGVVKRSKEDNEGLQPTEFKGYQILKKNEIVFKLIDLQNVSTSRVGLSNYTGIVSPAYIILKGIGTVLPAFAEKFFLSMWYRNIFNQLGDSGVRSNLNANELLNVDIAYPNLNEQHKIADFLDHKCSEIDALTADIQTQIETLEEYKKSVITEAVTKGLDPNVEMKDSGVEWIGKIPKKWSVIPVKFCFLITNGSDPKTKEGSTPVYGSGASSFKTCVECKKGPTVLLGRKGTVNIPQWIEGYYWNVDTAFDVHPLGNYALKLFYYCSICFDYDNYSTQTALPSMTQATYLNFRIPFMEKSQQDEIVLFLDNKCSEIDQTISEKQQQLEILAEYKKSLIYEYVTGKKEVS